MNPRPVAFITGASGGIGAAAVQAFAEAGYDVAMLDIEGEGMDAVSSRARAGGAETLTYVVDLSDLAAAQAAMEDTVARWDRIHVLVNNAAWRTHETMRAIELETWERTLRVCLTAPAFLAKCAAKD